MKPFDLELAKAGHPVCTRSGRKVRILCFDKKGNFPICTLVDCGDFEIDRNYQNDGQYFSDHSSDYDLMMAPVKKEGWINVFRIDDESFIGVQIYKTKEEAHAWGKGEHLIDTIKIEWEE